MYFYKKNVKQWYFRRLGLEGTGRQKLAKEACRLRARGLGLCPDPSLFWTLSNSGDKKSGDDMFLVKIKDIFTLRAGPDGLKTGRFKSECADSSDHSFLTKNTGSCRTVKENNDMNKFYFFGFFTSFLCGRKMSGMAVKQRICLIAC